MSENGRPVVTEEQVERWSRALLSDDGLLGASFKLKRWTPDAIVEGEVGFDGDRFTFPIRDSGNALVGVVRYAPEKLRANGQRKSIADSGTQRNLFPPPELIAGDQIVLDEGEADTITALSAGLPAVGVPGTGGWKAEYAERFRDRHVIICMDCDRPGRKAAREIAKDLIGIAASVRIYDLAPGLNDGYDLGDALCEGVETVEELQQTGALFRQQAAAMPVIESPYELEDWPSLASSSPLPSFPIEAVPAVVADWISATAEATQTPLDLAACDALGVLAACVAGQAQVEVVPGWREELCLFMVCAAESGERKTTVMRGATAPLRDIERERIAEATPRVAEAKTRREAIDHRRRKLISDAAKAGSSTDRDAHANEAATLAAQLAAEPEPHVPRLLADDATPEALGGLLARHGQIAVLAAESAFLDNLAGRYAEGRSNLHLVCQAYDGEPTTIDRASREPKVLDRPLLTMTLTVQPHVLAALVADPIARGQGFVARCLVSRPTTLLGHRKIDTQPVPETTRARWAGLVRRLAELRETRDTSDKTEQTVASTEVLSLPSRVFSLSADGRALLRGLLAKHELRLSDDGDLRPIASWHARHAGRIACIAALLHLAADEPGDEISADTMRDALAIGEWSLAHALDVLTGPDSELRRALAWLRRNAEWEVSTRDLQRAMHSTSDEAQTLADRLEAHGALRALEQPQPTKRGGRRRSPRFAVHPDLMRRGAAVT